jgi:hypothetical protein
MRSQSLLTARTIATAANARTARKKRLAKACTGPAQATTPGPMAAETQIMVAKRVARVEAASRFRLVVIAGLQ